MHVKYAIKIALFLSLVLAALVPVEANASTSSCRPPAGYTWASSAPFATHELDYAGTAYTIGNNQWGAVPRGAHSLLWAGRHGTGSWGVCALEGAGWPYPEETVQEGGKRVNRMTAFSASWGISVPALPAASVYEAAWDIWLNAPKGKPGSTEFMVWVYNHHQNPGNTPYGIVRAGGNWQLGVSVTHRRVGLVATVNRTSGRISLKDLLVILEANAHARPLLTTDPRVYEADFGFEIHRTAGLTLPFTVSHYALAATP